MKARTILARCRSAESDKRRIQQQIQRRREAIACISPCIDGIGGGRGTAEPDKIGAFVAAVDMLERRMERREEERRVEVAAACVLLDMLPDAESTALYEYYVNRLPATLVAKRMGYSEGYVRKLKAEGERLIDELPESAVTSFLPVWYMQAGAPKD